MSRFGASTKCLQYACISAFLLVTNAGMLMASQDRGVSKGIPDYCSSSALGSPYIPVDSWVYPSVLRLYSLGYLDNVYLGMRPWTRANLSNILERVDAEIEDANTYGESTVEEAQKLHEALSREAQPDADGLCSSNNSLRVESVYSVSRAITGVPLRDSFHLGQTIVNDYGRPYASGFNKYLGASGYATAGRFALYVRGEFQAAPSATGYSSALAKTLSSIDEIPYINLLTNQPFNQATIPQGPVLASENGRLIEGYVSAHILNHEISFGKQDEWIGPGIGAAMAYSNNAENLYSFRINRTEPLNVPGLSYFTGPFRYDFLIGSLKGHIYPNDPWMHLEKISFRPTANLEFGFERTVIWGGKGHAPITLESFLRGFFSFSSPGSAIKYSRKDPGARFGSFDFSYRLPYARNWLTLYTDSEVHDDISAIDAPNRAAWRPGLYLSHVPGVPKLDLRVEAVLTDPPISKSHSGGFMYYESVQRQGYTNKGMLFGDWIGREGKGGQSWITYHLSGNSWIQLRLRNQKVAKDFIPGGTTLDELSFQIIKRIGRDFQINGNFSYEKWKAPIYLPGQQTTTTTTIEITWFPERKINF